MNKIIFLLLMFSSFSLIADEKSLPAFSSKPIKYVTYDGDELLIGDKTKKGFLFWFVTTGPNGHQCSMAGKATRNGPPGGYWSFQRSKEGSCALTILSVENSYVLLDNGKCKKLHCGARASINGTVFSPK